MENISPRCSGNNNCFRVCNMKSCEAISFLCNNNQCDCYIPHIKCTTIQWKKIKQLFLMKLHKSQVKYKEYFTQIEQLYQYALRQIEKSLAQIKIIPRKTILNQFEKDVLFKLKQSKFSELSGSVIYKLQLQLLIQHKEVFFRNIEQQKKQVLNKINNLIQTLGYLGSQRPKLVQKKSDIVVRQRQSAVIENIMETIQGFFPKRIANIKLLFRASEHNFQVKKFWDICDNKKNTLTIIKTQSGRVIGGYTPLPWKTKLNDYSKDISKQSFIFSLTNKSKLMLVSGKQYTAICNSNAWGPRFGPNDIFICDRADKNRLSGVNVGNSYNNGQYIYQNKQSQQSFIGQQNGNYFKIHEWQVHQIVFE